MISNVFVCLKIKVFITRLSTPQGQGVCPFPSLLYTQCSAQSLLVLTFQ